MTCSHEALTSLSRAALPNQARRAALHQFAVVAAFSKAGMRASGASKVSSTP